MRLLDLFCGAGGAAVGYHRAGFDEIVGIDITPQPNYPFTFIQADALEPPVKLEAFDLIHASPPCQAYTPMANRWGSKQPELVELLELPEPYVIENVRGSPVRPDLVLTGGMFGLGVYRPRLFELGGWFAMSPPYAPPTPGFVSVYGKPDGRQLWKMRHAWGSLDEGRDAMGVGWMQTADEVRESIPPAYTQFIGEQFLASAP